MEPFVVMDCTLLTRMSGIPPALNLRELRDRITICSENVLYHHFCETTLRPTFDDPEYRNDFAVWAKQSLGDRVLAERLGIIDPYETDSMDELRRLLLDIIEDRLSELAPWVPMVRQGGEFYFMEATSVVFDTQERIPTPRKLSDAVKHMTNGSIYYHFLEALRRPPLQKDDFTAWLCEVGEAGKPFLEAIATIDPYFKTLGELRSELVRVIRKAANRR
jgi:hypothetical protein